MGTVSALLLLGSSGFVFATGGWLWLQGSLESFHRIALEDPVSFSTGTDRDTLKCKVEWDRRPFILPLKQPNCH